MRVITGTEERTIATPAAVMTGLAAPSQGSTGISTWRVQMNAGNVSPLHIVDREQIWMPTNGTFEFIVDGEAANVSEGEAIIVPANSTREFRVGSEAAAALVCMPAGGQAGTPGSDARQPVPWAL